VLSVDQGTWVTTVFAAANAVSIPYRLAHTTHRADTAIRLIDLSVRAVVVGLWNGADSFRPADVTRHSMHRRGSGHPVAAGDSDWIISSVIFFVIIPLIWITKPARSAGSANAGSAY